MSIPSGTQTSGISPIWHETSKIKAKTDNTHLFIPYSISKYVNPPFPSSSPTLSLPTLLQTTPSLSQLIILDIGDSYTSCIFTLFIILTATQLGAQRNPSHNRLRPIIQVLGSNFRGAKIVKVSSMKSTFVHSNRNFTRKYNLSAHLCPIFSVAIPETSRHLLHRSARSGTKRRKGD